MFWDVPEDNHSVALSLGDDYISYAKLAKRIARHHSDVTKKFGNRASHKYLVLFLFNNSLASVEMYLTLLQAGHVMMLVDPQLQAVKREALINHYQPNAIWQDDALTLLHNNLHTIGNELAVLVPTSGSTGSAKMVALSYTNLHSNAQSICDYLPIDASDIALGTLPLFYVYGLSVLHSHLLRRAHFRFSQYTLMEKGFWQQLQHDGITSFAGVPQWYVMLDKLGFTKREYSSLKYFTQAGGKLPQSLALKLADYAADHDQRFFIMYGQTEATARMAFLPSEKIATKPASIGQPIPGGTLRLVDEQGKAISASAQVGELVYGGPNIMLGYVTAPGEMSHFSQPSELFTGDLAYQDEQGDFFISGRKSRFAKINGARISLDEVEHWLHEQGIEGICLSDNQRLYVLHRTSAASDNLRLALCNFLSLNPSLVSVTAADAIPLLANGKTDYQQARRQLGLAA